MSSINLSLATRSNLLSLQTSQSLLNRTSNRLSTGLKVNKPIDDAAAFFAAQALTKTAGDFTTSQTAIQQASQGLDVALAGLTSITKLVQTLQGTLSSLTNATSAAQSDALLATYNSILTQIDTQANQSTYQGVNLLNNSSQSLGISFSNTPGSTDLSIAAIRSDSAGLFFSTFATGSGTFFQLTTTLPSQSSRNSVASVSSIQSTASRAAVNAVATLASTDSIVSVASLASVGSTPSVGSNATNSSIPSQSSTASFASVQSTPSRDTVNFITAVQSIPSVASRASIASLQTVNSVGSVSGVTIAAVNTSQINSVNTQIGQALATLSATQATLGASSAILSIRLEFSKSYISSLQQGAALLTVADLNEESANLTSLQTAQSLGVVSLSITNQAQQSLLRLF